MARCGVGAAKVAEAIRSTARFRPRTLVRHLRDDRDQGHQQLSRQRNMHGRGDPRSGPRYVGMGGRVIPLQPRAIAPGSRGCQQYCHPVRVFANKGAPGANRGAIPGAAARRHPRTRRTIERSWSDASGRDPSSVGDGLEQWLMEETDKNKDDGEEVDDRASSN